MKEFKIKDYLSDNKFRTLLIDVVKAENSDELKKALVSLDAFFSFESGLPCISISFSTIESNGSFHWEPFCIFINEEYLQCLDNVHVLAIYFHEKRHHLQYVCYEKKDLLLGKSILTEIDKYLRKEDVSVITKSSIFQGAYGYYGRLIEQDAYNYEKECVENLYEIGRELWGKVNNNLLESYYKKHCLLYNDEELIRWIEEHKRNFFIRKTVEEQLLFEVKQMISYDMENIELKKIIFIDKLFECLTEEEKRKVSAYFKGKSSNKIINKSNLYLEKIIKRRIANQKKLENRERKKSLR